MKKLQNQRSQDPVNPDHKYWDDSGVGRTGLLWRCTTGGAGGVRQLRTHLSRARVLGVIQCLLVLAGPRISTTLPSETWTLSSWPADEVRDQCTEKVLEASIIMITYI